MEEKLKVGSKVFRFDPNRRVYPSGSHGAPIYREHFYETEIVGETSRSWLVGPSWNQIKVSKKTLEGIFTAEQVDEACWVKENRYRIVRKVEGADYEQLKKIAEILGVE